MVLNYFSKDPVFSKYIYIYIHPPLFPYTRILENLKLLLLIYTFSTPSTVSCTQRFEPVSVGRSTANRHPLRSTPVWPPGSRVVLTRDSDLRSNDRRSRPARCDSDGDTRNRRVAAIS